MSLSRTDLSYISAAVTAASSVGIESVIIESGAVRAVDPTGSIVLLHTTNVPTFDFGSIGITRISTLVSLLAVAPLDDKVDLSATIEKMNGITYIRSLNIKGKGYKLDYRCANPATIRAPRALNGTDPAFKIHLDPSAITAMSKAKAAIGGEEITLSYGGDQVGYELSNINGDKFARTLSTSVDELDDAITTFSYKYPLKLLLTALNPSVNTYCTVTARGMLCVRVGGYDMYILPRNA